MQHDKPYNDLPLLPPKHTIESTATLKKAILANRELAELKGIGNAIPNQALILQLFALQEAKLSSEIENIVTTDDELYRAFTEKIVKTDTQTKEVLNYKDALWFGYDAITKKNRLLTTPLFEDLVKILATSGSGIRSMPGTKLANPMGKTIYTPPEGAETIRKLLSNIEQFIYAEDGIDPLVKLAIIHYQFEAIHPFYDGNGRTGRILNILYLVEKKLLDLPVLYLSRYIIQHKTDYYSLLLKVTQEEAWEEWIEFMLEGIYQTAKFTKERITIVQKLIHDTTQVVRDRLPKIYSKDLVELLFERPYCRAKFLEDAQIAKRQTASFYLQQLQKIGVLYEIKKGREKYYINSLLIQELVK